VRRSLSVLMFAGVVVLTAGCSTDFKPGDARAVRTVNITEGAKSRGVYGFSPNPVSVIPKTEVVWTNHDTENHQIESAGDYFAATKPIKPGASYSFTFQTPGSYRYFCSIPGHREEGVINVAP